MDLLFDPINSIITLPIHNFDYDNISHYLEKKGFFLPLEIESLVFYNKMELLSLKGQSPLNFILSVFIRENIEQSNGKLIEIGKRILKSSSGYRIAPLYFFKQNIHLVEYVSIRVYSSEILKDFSKITLNISDQDISILNLIH